MKYESYRYILFTALKPFRIFRQFLRKIIKTKERKVVMTKDSQPDNKKARRIKSKGNTPVTADGQNDSNTTKKQSARRGDV
jgi:hypothetical protein